jgi:putative (di)nucleoside polyphosphate hydrolase
MSRPDPESLPYRPCVGLMLINRAGLVFVAQRREQLVEAWQMPQGGVDPGEDPQAAAFRELEEEIGTANAEMIAQSARWLTYDLPEHLVGKVWGGRYRGQTMKWFLLRFLGEDSDINLETAHPEFSQWRWAGLDEIADLIVPFKRALYDQVVAEFGALVRPL